MRIQGVQDGQGSLLVRLAFWRMRSVWGQVWDPLRLYALVPRLMMAFRKMLGAVEKPRKLPMDLKSLAMARAASRIGCAFCVDATTYFAQEARVSNERITALRDGPGAAIFTPVENAVLRFTDQMTDTPARVDDATVAELKGHLGEVGLVELAGAIALENFSARFNHAFDCAPAGLAGRKTRSGA